MKHLRKYNPVTISYHCQHGKCKRICDMKVITKGNEDDIVLGSVLPDGEFLQSHFLHKQATLSMNTMIVEGETPTADVTIELHYKNHHFLVGTLSYHKHGGAFNQFPIHVHLEPTDEGQCSQLFVHDQSYESAHLADSDESEIRPQLGEERRHSISLHR